MESGQDSNEGSDSGSQGSQQEQEKNHYFSEYDPMDLWDHTKAQKYWTARNLQDDEGMRDALDLDEEEITQIVKLTDERPLMICPFMHITNCTSR